MRLVVDASVAVRWLVAEEGSEAAHRLAASGDDLHAPRLMVSEIANALWRKARLGEIERGRDGALMATVTEMPVRWSGDETVCADAVRLALTLDRRSTIASTWRWPIVSTPGRSQRACVS